MDRIIVEVDDAVAKGWRNATEGEKGDLNNKINRLISTALKKNKENFSDFLFRVSKKAEENGLTEEILNKLLNEEDL